MPPKKAAVAEELANINPLQWQSNRQTLSNFRVLCSLFVGAACGIVGVQGLHGFAVYFLQHALFTLPLAAKTGFKPKDYYPGGLSDLLTGQVLASETFMTFLLLWTVFFNFAHIF